MGIVACFLLSTCMATAGVDTEPPFEAIAIVWDAPPRAGASDAKTNDRKNREDEHTCFVLVRNRSTGVIDVPRSQGTYGTLGSNLGQGLSGGLHDGWTPAYPGGYVRLSPGEVQTLKFRVHGRGTCQLFFGLKVHAGKRMRKYHVETHLDLDKAVPGYTKATVSPAKPKAKETEPSRERRTPAKKLGD